MDHATSLRQALQVRPDYVAAQHTVESAKENVRFAKLARFPVAHRKRQHGRERIAPGNCTAAYRRSQSLGATLTVPIYDQGLTNYNVALAASQLDQANAALRCHALRCNPTCAVHSRISFLRARLSTQAQAELQSGQVNLQAVQARYRVGAATITDFVTAEATLATAQRDDVSAIYNERVAEERYTFALGTPTVALID